MVPTGRVSVSFGIVNYQFADDTQLFVAVDTANSADLTRVTDCSDVVQRCFLEEDFLLNGDKSETVIIGTAAQRKSTTVAGSWLPVSREVKSLFVTLGSHLTQLRFDSHIRAVAKACAYHTHALRHVRHLLTYELATTIAYSIVATRIDYCNSLL